MIIIELPLTSDVVSLNEMVIWCKTSCPDNYYYFPPTINLEEKAKFWFYNEVDAFAFKFRFGLTEG